jgi:hypothetical protein
MERSPFWVAKRSSGSQEIPSILYKPKVHYRIHKPVPPFYVLFHVLNHMSPLHCLCCTRISPIPRPCEIFRNIVSLYDEELFAPRPTPSWKITPLSAVRDIIKYICSWWRPFLHPLPEDVPCRSDMDPLIMAWDINASLNIWRKETWHTELWTYLLLSYDAPLSVSVNCVLADRSKAWVYGRSLTGIVGSNPA